MTAYKYMNMFGSESRLQDVNKNGVVISKDMIKTFQALLDHSNQLGMLL